MDLTGVPQKINRHVMKALFQNCREGLTLSELIEYVRLCNRNLKPVANLNKTVYKSLRNFVKLGMIVKYGKNRYKIVEYAVSNPNWQDEPSTSRRMRKESSTSTAQKRSFARNDDVDESSTRKRHKSDNVGNGNKNAANLLRNTRHLDLNSRNQALIAGNYSSHENYDDESLEREPGADDRDSGDDLCVKEHSDPNKEEVEKPEQNVNPNANEGMSEENDADVENTHTA